MASQNTRDIIYLKMANEMSKMSNCISYNVGCMIVKDGRPICTGYNGTVSGFINCDEKFKDIKARFGPEPFTAEERQRHHEWSNNFEVHGEMNAIIFAAKFGISINDSVLYSTVQPCHNCLKHLIAAGIKRIVYSKPYDKANYTKETLALIEKTNTILECIEI